MADTLEIVIVIKGGMVEGVYGAGLPPGVTYVVVDRDGDCDEAVVIHRATRPPLTVWCDTDDGDVIPMDQPCERTSSEEKEDEA